MNRIIKENLVSREEIKEDLKLIYCSEVDYITPTGKIYSYYKEFDKYYPKTSRINEHNGYAYCFINKICKGTNRVHKLIAMAYVENPNPEKLTIVGHKNNIKHDNRVDNLYWTTNKENVDKAIEDGLLKSKEGIENKDSIPLKVVLKDDVVAVYGSICEASRYIENIDKTYLAKMIRKNGDYTPRSRKYKYIPITKEEYNTYEDSYKNKFLIEYDKVDKSPKVFKAINVITGEELVCDNQKKFARDYKLEQALISNAVLNNSCYGGWKFELIKSTTYKESSGYDNYIETLSDIIIKSIKTGEVKIFTTKKELKEHLGLEGNDILQYFKRNNLILSEWEIISC